MEKKSDRKFAQWFDENSGYALHRPKKRQFSQKDCCGKPPEQTERRILFPDPVSGRMEPFLLYQCRNCGKLYVTWQGGFAEIENLMKYQILP